MRIAVFHNLPSGGAKRSLYEAVRRLAVRHHICVFSVASADHRFADLRQCVASHQIVEFSPLPLFSSPFGRINSIMRIMDLLRLKQVYRSVARIIDQHGCDVALVEPCQYENSPSVISELRHTPAVFYCHEPLRILYEATPFRPYLETHSARRNVLDRFDPFPVLYRFLLKCRDRVNIRNAGMVLVNSRFISDAVRRIYGIAPHVSYHGVDTAKFRPLWLNRDRTVLSVGSLTPLKGFDFLIRAIARIPSARRPPLMIVSNFQYPPERQFLEHLAQELCVELRLANDISEESLVECYNRCYVVLYAPIREPFGMVPLEAMACGVPVVATREGGVPESVVDEKTGLLVQRDTEEFAAAIQRLLDNPVLASELGRNGRLHVESNWSWDRAVSTLEGYLSDSFRP